jgi:uncharacterized membrane protein
LLWSQKTTIFKETHLLVNGLIIAGRMIFASGIMALGILQFFAADYIIGRPPSPAWSANIPGKLSWAYVSGTLLVLAGLCILFRIKAGFISLLTGLLIIICSFFLRSLPDMWKETFMNMIWRLNAWKSLALGGGAIIVAVSFFNEKKGVTSTNRLLLTISVILLSFFLIICGFAHYKFDDFIINGFIPSYIPAHPFWTYFTGAALIAGGVGLLINPVRKWAALFSGIMILLWFFLLHIPRAAAASNDNAEWMGVFESFAFAGILFVLAGLWWNKPVISTGSNTQVRR